MGAQLDLARPGTHVSGAGQQLFPHYRLGLPAEDPIT